jgi:hypothetical protein
LRRIINDCKHYPVTHPRNPSAFVLCFLHKNDEQKRTPAAEQPVFHKVAKNLYRPESSDGYYALLKRGGKQFRRPPNRHGCQPKTSAHLRTTGRWTRRGES